MMLSDSDSILYDLMKPAQSETKKLDFFFANEIGDTYEPPDELIEGILTCGDFSVIYGDSNTGKTFIAIDMAASIARGIPWFGRKTECGIIVYLAVESPSSVKRRLQAYQKYHNVKIDNFIVVKNPINLFDTDEDASAIIYLVKELEKTTGIKVRMIIGDTLARMVAGGNESSGQDMGIVIKHADTIRDACNVHFAFIHHSGKNAAAGQRGWSGVRGAIDTEIEVTDTMEGRCAEITKQRDLDTKGERIGFRLEPVIMGKSKWGKDVTSCVAMSTDAPAKKKSKKLGEMEGKIMEYLYTLASSGTNFVTKTQVVKHFDDRHLPQSVYNSIKRLIENNHLRFSNGFLSTIN